MPECYIRGSTIKYLRIPDEIIDMVKEEVVSKGRGRGGSQQNKMQGKGRGAGGRGERNKFPTNQNSLLQQVSLSFIVDLKKNIDGNFINDFGGNISRLLKFNLCFS